MRQPDPHGRPTRRPTVEECSKVQCIYHADIYYGTDQVQLGQVYTGSDIYGKLGVKIMETTGGRRLHTLPLRP